MQVILGYSSEWYPPLDPATRCIALCSSSSELNSGLFLSARLLPETNSSRDELLFTRRRCGRLHARVSCGCLESEKCDRLVGLTALEIMSWDGKNWTSRWFHTDYFKLTGHAEIKFAAFTVNWATLKPWNHWPKLGLQSVSYFHYKNGVYLDVEL